MKKIFTYFVEPASYTLDLIKNVHSKLDISFVFINSKSEAMSDKLIKKDFFLSERLFYEKIGFVYNIWKNNKLIIINGYNNYPFLLSFIFNLFSLKKRYLAIESDTQLKVPNNVLKRLFKSLYLNTVFRNKYVLGFAGGSLTHKQLFRFYGMKEERIFLMPMMVDNSKYLKAIKRKPEKFTFLFVGRLINSKNVNILCERFLSSFNSKNAHLIIVGSGINLEKYKKKYIHNQITFTGAKFGDELLNYYKNSSVFVFPSTEEAWGLVINEAMSSGLPVITHKNVGSVHDLIFKKNTGFIIESWDDLELKMNELYSNPELCVEFSKNAIQLMDKEWNYDLYKYNLLLSIKKVEQCL
tara:strand:- start:461 stop:1522 length:1062 start_codon:yes stop_codon:yes gene_type:complete